MKGKVQFNDMNILKSTIKDFNKLGEALTYIANFEKMEGVRQQFEKAAENTKDRNQKAKFRQQLKGLTSIKNLAKDQGLYQAPDFLENLTFVLDYGFQDQFEVQMPIEPYIFSSNFNRAYLREDEHLLVRKYSRFAEKKFVLFGVVAQSSSDLVYHEEDDEDNYEFRHIKEAIMSLVEKLSIVESTFSGKLENEIIIDPIALYREI